MGSDLLNTTREKVMQFPGWYGNWARAALAESYGLLQIECTGPDALANLRQLQKILPSTAIICAAENNSSLPIFENKFAAGINLIFICFGNTCYEPVTNVDQAMEIIQDIFGFIE
jgi:uncharacterized protein YyaL (SSP411 family)